jgi:hypothetical protein
MMAILWVVLGLGAMVLIMTVVSLIFGRGHLGAEQSESHYLDEVEAMAHTPYI